MKFKEAFEEVLKRTPDNLIPKGDDNIPKTLTFIWSMIAISEKKLDDVAYISENKSIVSIPLQKSPSSEKTATNDENNVAEKEKKDGKKKKKSTKEQ